MMRDIISITVMLFLLRFNIEMGETTTASGNVGSGDVEVFSQATDDYVSCNGRVCHINATCQLEGGEHCQCKTGYTGNGTFCEPTNLCLSEGDILCPNLTSYCLFDGPGVYHCECFQGYENFTSGLGCSLVDVCYRNTSLCHKHATCATLGPERFECTCRDGYRDDGQNNCYGNILQTLIDLNNTDGKLRGQLVFTIQILTKEFKQTLEESGPYTLFIPTDRAVKKSLNDDQRRILLKDKEAGRYVMKLHMLPIARKLDELMNTTVFYTLEGASQTIFVKKRTKQLKVRLQGSKTKSTCTVVLGDLETTSGILHIVDRVLFKFPTIKGYKHKNLLTQIKTEGRYNRFEGLLEGAGLGKLLTQLGPMTVFSPSNGAWDFLPPGSLEYLTSSEGQEKLKIILRHHIVNDTELFVEDMLQAKRFQTSAHQYVEVSVNYQGRIQLNGNINVTSTGIEASNGYYHHIEGVLLPPSALPLLPHRCDVSVNISVRGPCGACFGKLHCQHRDEVPVKDSVKITCFYKLPKSHLLHVGCSITCQKTLTTPRCCPGFYGPKCYPCPGGFMNPCFGRGKCLDGRPRSGRCECQDIYTGSACEFCANETRYGPSCNNSCSCLHGVCDNRVSGSQGVCRANSCKNGYSGLNCDQVIQKCGPFGIKRACPINSECVSIRRYLRLPSRFIRRLSLNSKYFNCKCKQGYRKLGERCEEINMCTGPRRGGCHLQANCIKTGPGTNKCECIAGFTGDGNFCYPESPCLHFKTCHTFAICKETEPGETHCVCLIGFHGNGTHCVAENVCTWRNGGCHSQASCTPDGPGRRNCSCPDTMGGDGVSCFSSINDELKNQPRLSVLHELLQTHLTKHDTILDDLSQNLTLFAPTDEVFQAFIDSAKADFWMTDLNVLIMLSYHIVLDALSVNDLRNLSGQSLETLEDDADYKLKFGTNSKGKVLVNKATVVVENIPALNGYIHIIDKVLEPYLVPWQRPDLGTFVKKNFPNFFKSAQKFQMFQSWESLSEYTLFLPNKDQRLNMKFATRRYFEHYIAPEEVVASKLVSGLKLPTLLGNASFQKLNVTRSEGKIYVGKQEVIRTNIWTKNGVVHTINGVLDPILNWCQQYSYHLQKYIRQCCDGFFGVQCSACPGGVDTPCSGSGNCSQGLSGTGFCRCESGFTGRICELCEHPGQSPRTCKKKDLCKNNGGCHQNAECKSGGDHVTCRCHRGYTGDGKSCKSGCLTQNGGCHPLAKCTIEKQVGIICTCPVSYTGTGLTCDPVQEEPTTSTTSTGCGDCHPSAECFMNSTQGPLCTCSNGFTGNGTWCGPINFGKEEENFSETTSFSIKSRNLIIVTVSVTTVILLVLCLLIMHKRRAEKVRNPLVTSASRQFLIGSGSESISSLDKSPVFINPMYSPDDDLQ